MEGAANLNEDEGIAEDGEVEEGAAEGRLHGEIGQPLLPGSQGAEGVGSQGTQNVSATQLPDITSLPSLEEAHNTYIPTKDERFVSRYIANAIYCIIWKYRDIAIFRKYRDILTIFSVSDNGQF